MATRKDKLKVFISYARRNLQQADSLVSALESHDFEVVIDRRDLPYGEEWQAELADFIRGADAVLWLVSPDSVGSRWVNWELGEVGRLNKRLIPVRIDDIDPSALPEALGKIHLLPADGVFDAQRDLTTLINTLNADRKWLKEATRLSDRARQWLIKGRDEGLLLRGAALADAEMWSSRQPVDAPLPPSEVLDLILASRLAQTRRQRWTIGLSLSAALGGIALAAVAYLYQQRAEANAGVATQQRDRAFITQSRFLADLSDQRFTAGDHVTSALLALEGLPDAASGIERPAPAEVQLRLDRAWRTKGEDRSPREKHVFKGHRDWILGCKFAPNAAIAATVGKGDGIRTWSTESGAQLKSVSGSESANGVLFSKDGSRLLTTSPNAIQIWHAVSGEKLAEFPTDPPATLVAISADGRSVLSSASDNIIRVWNVESGKEANALPATKILRLGFDGSAPRAIVTGSDFVVTVVDPTTGQMIATLAGHTKEVIGARFSGDFQFVASWEDDGEVRVWKLADGARIATRQIKSIVFDSLAQLNRNGTLLIYTDGDGYVLFNIPENKEVAKLSLGEGGVSQVVFSPDDTYVVASLSTQEHGTFQNTARVWDTTKGDLLGTIRHENELMCIDVSADSRQIISGSTDKSVRVWTIGKAATAADAQEQQISGQLIRLLSGHEKPITGIRFSDDGRRFLTFTAEERDARIWNAADGELVAVLSGHEGKITNAYIAKDGSRALTRSDDKTLRVWDMTTGKQIVVFKGHNGVPQLAAFDNAFSRITSIDSQSVAIVWDPATGATLATRDLKPGDLQFVTAEPAGSRALVKNANRLELWDLYEGNWCRRSAATGRLSNISGCRMTLRFFSQAAKTRFCTPTTSRPDGSERPSMRTARIFGTSP